MNKFELNAGVTSKGRGKNSPKSSYRLIDFVLLIGADVSKKLPSQTIDSTLAVIWSYPDVHDSILASKLPQLCFPAGYAQADAPQKPFLSPLVITDERKREYYLVTLTFYLKVPSNNQPDIYLPYCLCIYSQFSVYGLFREVLCGAWNQHFQACKEFATCLMLFEKDAALQKNIKRVVDETPAPTHGKLRFILSVFNQQHSYGLPSLDDFPVHELPLITLFTTLDSQKIVQLLNHMLFDQQLLFISPDPAVLGVLLEGLRSLLYPLAWEHVYVTCLPTAILHNVLQAPIPFMLGASLKNFSDSISKELILVDLSNNGMFCAAPEHPFPHRLVTKLTAQITEILRKYAGAQVDWGAVRSIDAVGESSVQMDIREAFLTFFVGILKDVEKFIDVENDAFRESEYIASFSSRKQPFMQALMKTQAFEQLRLRMAMGSPSVQLFKECIVAKYMEKSCKRVFNSKREERAKPTFYPLPVSNPDDKVDETMQRQQGMISDVTNLMIQPNDHNTQATLLVFRSSLHGQMGEFFAALQDIHRSIQLDDSVVTDEQINFYISQLTEIEISKAISAFGPRIKRCIVLAKNAGKKTILPSTSMKNMGLKAEQKISVQLRQNISNLQLELGAVKRQNLAYKMEIGALKEQVAELTSSQVSSSLQQSENWEEYDVVFDIRGIKQLHEGWPVIVKSDKYGLFEPGVQIKGSIAAFVGLYNKGKTFLLNKLSDATLPSGSKVTTRGISVKVPKSFAGQMILLDTAGTHAPIQYRSNDALLDRRATELFLQDVIFDITDYHICVVNDLTWQDQEYIDTLVKKLQETQKQFRQVIVVHNFKGCMDVDDALDHWKAQVIDSYPDGEEFIRPMHTPGGEVAEVRYYVSGNVRHLFIGKEYTPCGERFNEATYALLRGWLRDVVVEYGKTLSPLKVVVDSSNKHLMSYIEGNCTVGIDVSKDHNAVIRFTGPQDVPIHLRPFTLGWLSPKIEPDNFVPLMDKYSYKAGVLYVLELPGVLKQDLKISQKEWPNVYIEGEKKRQFYEGHTFEHAETKSGSFKIRLSVDSSLDPTSREIKFADSILQIRYKYYNWEEKE
jgi:HSP20 family molecular chaperone IbpA